MDCCKKIANPSAQNLPFFVSPESRQWLVMMKYMLECAEQSIEYLDLIKEDLEFNNDDMEKFTTLCIALEQARHQMALLGRKFFEVSPAIDFLQDITFFIDPKDTETILKSGFSQTGQDDATGNGTKKKDIARRGPTRKDACLCNVFKQNVIRKSKDNKIVVCSPLKRSLLVNEKCLKDGQPSSKVIPLKPEDFPHDDNHPFIIKNKGGMKLPDTGFGYELFYAMHRHRNQVAQIDEASGDIQTYAEILRDTISTALNLKKLGLNENSIISLCLITSKYSSLPYLAGLFLGCKMNGLDVSFNRADLGYYMRLATPDIMFVQKEKVDDILAVIQENGFNIQIVVVGGDVEGHRPFQEFLIGADEDIKSFRPYKADDMKRDCIILFSSGTSGNLKAIRLSHINMLGQVYFITVADDLQQMFLNYASYYWISSVVLMAYCILAGLTRVVPLPFDVERFYQLLDKYKVEYAFVGPSQCVEILKTPKPPDLDSSSLRTLVTGGAPLKESFFVMLRKAFPGCLVYQIYGLTECGGILVKWATRNPEDRALIKARVLSSGRPFAGYWYKIVDDDTNKILGPFQQGHLHVKSDTLLMTGYHKMDSTENFDEFGYLKTGDVAYFDEYHCLYVVDRLKELIKRRMWHIIPVTLETALMAHPAVARAVVIGIPHSEDSEHALGCIILKEGVDENTVNLEEIAESVNSQVDERNRLLGGVKIIHKLPLTPTGKVKRMALRDAILKGEDL